MSIAEQVYDEVRKLPEALRREVLDFIGYLEFRHGLTKNNLENLKQAQQPSMEKVWKNTEDEAWNEW